MPPNSSTSNSDVLLLARRLARFAPVGALVVVTNAFLDPETGMRKGALEHLLFEELQAGRAVRFVGDDRRLNRLYFERASAEVEVLVLGSSRSMPVGTRQVGGRTIWNASLTGGRLEEIAVLYFRAAASRLAPRTVLLSLDLTHLQHVALETRSRRMQFVAEFGKAESSLGVTLVPHRDLALLRLMAAMQPVSLANFQRALLRGAGRSLWVGLSPRQSEVFAAAGDRGQLLVRRSDGSVSFPPASALGKSIDARDALPEGQAARLDGNGILALEGIVARMRADGRRVAVLMPPYHPVFVARADLRSLLGEAEERVRRWARSRALPLIGSFDAAVCGCDSDEFFDARHPTEPCFDHFLAAAVPR